MHTSCLRGSRAGNRLIEHLCHLCLFSFSAKGQTFCEGGVVTGEKNQQKYFFKRLPGRVGSEPGIFFISLIFSFPDFTAELQWLPKNPQKFIFKKNCHGFLKSSSEMPSPPYTPAGFDLTTHSSSDGDDTTRPRGRCYDYNFRRFLPIFGKKVGVFSKSNVTIKFLQKLAVCSLSKKRQFFRRKYF
jgi:hypothetical protein